MTLLTIENEVKIADQAQANNTLADIYTKPDCVQCGMTYQLLIEMGIDFKVRNLTQDPDALEDVKKLGYMQAPVVVTNDSEHWSGFNADRIKAFADTLSEAGINLVPTDRDFAVKLAKEVKELVKQDVAEILVINGEILVPEAALDESELVA